MLEIKRLEAGYGKKQVLFGPSLEVKEGEVIGVIGPNGSGKSTLLKAICGVIPIWKGKVLFNHTTTNGLSPAKNIGLGITFCPQGNRVFDELSVIENLEIGGFQLPKRELNNRIDEMFQLFPVLKDRCRLDARKLSSGERQMLALSRALISKPRLIMLDEPSLGLSVDSVNVVFEKLRTMNRNEGLSLLIVEQKVRKALEVCHRIYALKLGKLAFTGSSDDLRNNMAQLKQLFL